RARRRRRLGRLPGQRKDEGRIPAMGCRGPPRTADGAVMKTAAPARLWSLLDCRTDAPQSDAPGQRSWIARTAYFTVVLTEIDGQASLSRTDNPDEYMAVVPAGIRAIAQAGEETLGSDGNALFIVPPGDSTLEVQGKGMVVRVFSHLASDLAAIAANQA